MRSSKLTTPLTKGQIIRKLKLASTSKVLSASTSPSAPCPPPGQESSTAKSVSVEHNKLSFLTDREYFKKFIEKVVKEGEEILDLADKADYVYEKLFAKLSNKTLEQLHLASEKSRRFVLDILNAFLEMCQSVMPKLPIETKKKNSNIIMKTKVKAKSNAGTSNKTSKNTKLKPIPIIKKTFAIKSDRLAKLCPSNNKTDLISPYEVAEISELELTIVELFEEWENLQFEIKQINELFANIRFKKCTGCCEACNQSQIPKSLPPFNERDNMSKNETPVVRKFLKTVRCEACNQNQIPKSLPPFNERDNASKNETPVRKYLETVRCEACNQNQIPKSLPPFNERDNVSKNETSVVGKYLETVRCEACNQNQIPKSLPPFNQRDNASRNESPVVKKLTSPKKIKESDKAKIKKLLLEVLAILVSNAQEKSDTLMQSYVENNNTKCKHCRYYHKDLLANNDKVVNLKTVSRRCTANGNVETPLQPTSKYHNVMDQVNINQEDKSKRRYQLSSDRQLYIHCKDCIVDHNSDSVNNVYPIGQKKENLAVKNICKLHTIGSPSAERLASFQPTLIFKVLEYDKINEVVNFLSDFDQNSNLINNESDDEKHKTGFNVATDLKEDINITDTNCNNEIPSTKSDTIQHNDNRISSDFKDKTEEQNIVADVDKHKIDSKEDINKVNVAADLTDKTEKANEEHNVKVDVDNHNDKEIDVKGNKKQFSIAKNEDMNVTEDDKDVDEQNLLNDTVTNITSEVNRKMSIANINTNCEKSSSMTDLRLKKFDSKSDCVDNDCCDNGFCDNDCCDNGFCDNDCCDNGFCDNDCCDNSAVENFGDSEMICCDKSVSSITLTNNVDGFSTAECNQYGRLQTNVPNFYSDESPYKFFDGYSTYDDNGNGFYKYNGSINSNIGYGNEFISNPGDNDDFRYQYALYRDQNQPSIYSYGGQYPPLECINSDNDAQYMPYDCESECNATVYYSPHYKQPYNDYEPQQYLATDDGYLNNATPINPVLNFTLSESDVMSFDVKSKRVFNSVILPKYKSEPVLATYGSHNLKFPCNQELSPAVCDSPNNSEPGFNAYFDYNSRTVPGVYATHNQETVHNLSDHYQEYPSNVNNNQRNQMPPNGIYENNTHDSDGNDSSKTLMQVYNTQSNCTLNNFNVENDDYINYNNETTPGNYASQVFNVPSEDLQNNNINYFALCSAPDVYDEELDIIYVNTNFNSYSNTQPANLINCLPSKTSNFSSNTVNSNAIFKYNLLREPADANE